MKSLTIIIPTYALEDDQLIELAQKLQPFADGDPDCRDDDGPCVRAVEAIRTITEELRYRGSTFVLEADGSIRVDPETEH